MKSAILTKYVQASNTKPSRVVAWAPDNPACGRVYVSYDSGGDMAAAHAKAAQAFCDKWQWTGPMVQGNIRTGYAFVFVEG